MKLLIIILATVAFTFTSCEKEPSPKTTPVVTTNEVINIQAINATLEGEISNNGGADIIERGFIYSEINTSLTIEGENITQVTSTLEISSVIFRTVITELEIGTTYYVCAYATNSAGTTYGETVDFSTPSTLPSVITRAVSNRETTSATLVGDIPSNGGSDITEKGFVYSKTNLTPTIGDTDITNVPSTLGEGTGEFTSDISGLEIGGKYYMRAYAINSSGTSYGELVVFSTINTISVFILTEGGINQNNASLALYDTDKKLITHNIFAQLNGKALGDTANDILIYGTKMYIAVDVSKVIFVTDLNGKIIEEIKHRQENTELSPRKLTKLDGKVYVSYFEGYAGQIDTTSYAVKSVKIGPNPEGIVGINNKIYVANSDGYFISEESAGRPRVNTVSVIDAASFTVSKNLDVVTNPGPMILADNGSIYFASLGVYDPVTYSMSPSTLQKIDPMTDKVTILNSTIDAGRMSMGKDNKLYLLCGAPGYPSSFAVLNTTNDVITEGFITDDTVIRGAYSISADPVTGNVYIGKTSYSNNADMYVFSAEGKKLDMFDAGGPSPSGAFFISK